MSPRTLKVALAISVALNLFAVGLAAGGVIVGARLADDRRTPRHQAFSEAVAAMSPETREAVRTGMRQVALSARPDFREARRSRREAIEAARAEPFDAAQVEALLGRSRAAEARGRARLEAGTIEILQTLSPADRAAFAPTILSRRGHGFRRGGRDGRPRDSGEASGASSSGTP